MDYNELADNIRSMTNTNKSTVKDLNEFNDTIKAYTTSEKELAAAKQRVQYSLQDLLRS